MVCVRKRTGGIDMKIPRKTDRKIEAYQQELIKTHFAEVDNMVQRSTAEKFSSAGICASASTLIPRSFAREIFEFKIVSVMGFPVLNTVSTVQRSASSSLR